MANSSLKDDIYSYLNSQAGLTALVAQIGWGQMPSTAISKKQIVYGMISDPRVHLSKQRNQRWRFWICVPVSNTNPKASCEAIGNKMLDVLHEIKGSFGTRNIQWSENVSNQTPFLDDQSQSWILIQDYMLKMKTLQ